MLKWFGLPFETSQGTSETSPDISCRGSFQLSLLLIQPPNLKQAQAAKARARTWRLRLHGKEDVVPRTLAGEPGLARCGGLLCGLNIELIEIERL